MVQSMVFSQKVDFILIQETKWKQVHERLIRQIWGSDNFNWAAVESEGCSGGLLCIWNPDIFSTSQIIKYRNFMCIKGSVNSIQCVIVNI